MEENIENKDSENQNNENKDSENQNNEKKIPKWQKYRLKDIEAYRKRKREYAKTPEQRKVRREYMKIWREKNREKHNELCRKSRQKNRQQNIKTPEQKQKDKERSREKRLKRNRNNNIIRNYGITFEQKNEMICQQDNKCLICQKKFTDNSRQIHLDHCHKTGKIRGILCAMCNVNLSWFEANHDNVINYLDRNTE